MAAFTALIPLSWQPPAPTGVTEAMHAVAHEISLRYRTAVAIAYHSAAFSASAAAGFVDGGLGLGAGSRPARAEDVFVWGSTTKMYTAPAVLKLVESGVVSLSDPITEHVDAETAALLRRRIPNISLVQVGHLLHMTSGLADYDGAAYSSAQFAHREHDFSPLEIIRRFVTAPLRFPPGSAQMYSSTNYVVLGLLLARHMRSPSWQALDQLSVIPEAERGSYPRTSFATAGPCKAHTPVHGFMQGYPTSPLPEQDVWNVSCVGGWTAGNLLAPVAEVARFTFDLYRRGGGIVSEASQRLLTNFSAPPLMGHLHFKFYGMGTFSLNWSVGHNTTAYGHVGDTYGYQSQTTFFPDDSDDGPFVLTVATNVETLSQAQPADATCRAYHAVRAALAGLPAPICNFTVPLRFIGNCTCHY